MYVSSLTIKNATPIERLKLSNRAYNALISSNINSVEMAVFYAKFKKLDTLKGIGERAEREILNALRLYGKI